MKFVEGCGKIMVWSFCKYLDFKVRVLGFMVFDWMNWEYFNEFFLVIVFGYFWGYVKVIFIVYIGKVFVIVEW